MRVEVEHILTGGFSGVVLHIHAVGRERRTEQLGDAMHHDGDLAVRSLGHLPQVSRMDPGNHEGVPWGGGSDVEERHRVLVLEDAIRRLPTSDDLAEDAFTHAGHDRMRPFSETTGFPDRP